MKIASFLLTLIFICAAMAGEVFILVAYRGDGANGSMWRTEISVSNITPGIQVTPVQTTITLHRENIEPVSIAMPLSQMEVLSIPDAIWSWFGVENGGGIVRVTWGNPAPRSFRQFHDIFSYFQAGPLDAAMVRITGSNGTLYAYASVVRNDTGDATFVTPAQ